MSDTARASARWVVFYCWSLPYVRTVVIDLRQLDIVCLTLSVTVTVMNRNGQQALTSVFHALAV